LKLLESNERLEDAKQARQGIPSEVRREVRNGPQNSDSNLS
jgi:hypothetical protein